MGRIASILFSALTLLGMSSCEDTPPADLGDIGYNYYPLEIGSFKIFNVDSVVYDDFTSDSTRYAYQIKEFIESVYEDGEGRDTYRIERWRRDSLDGAWRPAGVRSTTLVALRAERTEENLRYIKLAFPLVTGKSWDGNAFNFMAIQEYQITSLDMPFSIGADQYDSTMTVRHADLLTVISEEYNIEVYARGLGLIYLKDKKVETSVTGIIESGYDYSFRLIDHGIE